MCFISHDLFFVKEIADHVVEVNSGCVKHFHGGLDYYLEKKAGIEADLQDKAHAAKSAMAQVQKNHSKRAAEENLPPHLRDAQQQQAQAIRRLEEIKKETKALSKEQQDLETESYVKSRFMSDSFGRDPQMIKEYGVRLKEVQRRQREIAVTLDKLQEEKMRISK